MGLYADLQKDLSEAFNTDLLDAYVDFQLVTSSEGDYDTITGVNTVIETTTPFKGIDLTNIDKASLDSPANIYDLKIFVLDSDKPTTFTKEQKINYSNISYRLMIIDTDPVKAGWVLKCMVWN